MSDPTEMTLTGLAAAIRRRNVSSLEATKALLARIEKWQPALNAYARVDAEDALKSAKAADQDVRVEPARCRSCGYTFGKDKMTKPSKCPECKGTRLYEPLVQIKM